MSTGDFPRVGFGGGELKAGNSNGLQLSLLDALKPDSGGTLPNITPNPEPRFQPRLCKASTEFIFAAGIPRGRATLHPRCQD